MARKVAIKPMDAAWFYVEKREAPAHFGPLLILTPPSGAKKNFVRELVNHWRSCRQFAPPFNYQLSPGALPSWQVLADDEVDLEYHLRHSALPSPGDEQELGILVSRLHSHALDRRRPLWECNVIEGLEGGRFAIYLKLHHGQLDGMGAAQLLARCFSTDAQARNMLPPWSIGTEASKASTSNDMPKQWQKLGGSLATAPRVIKSLSGMLREALSKQGSGGQLSVPFQAPRSMLNGRIHAPRRYATQHYELKRLKAVAKAGGVTLNDVFLAISGSALRRYLLEQDSLPQKSLIGQIPVNLRREGDSGIGNALSFMYAALGTDIEQPLDRLRAVHDATEAAKAVQLELPEEGVELFTMLLLGPYISEIMLNLGGYLKPAANLVISNVSGPRERLYLNGARVEQIYGPSVLFHGQALNITMSSYAGEINIGYTGCRDSLPSMQRLAVYTREALEELEAALKLGSSPNSAAGNSS